MKNEEMPKDKNLPKDNNKRLLAIFVAIMCIIAVGISGYGIATKIIKNNEPKEEETKKEEITPLMYKVTKEGSDNVMYLFGSMHIVNFNDFDMPKYVMDAYNESDYLAVELDINKYMENEKIVQNLALDMLYQDGTTIKNHLDEEIYNKLISFLKAKNLYNQVYENFKPYGIVSLLTSKIAIDAGLKESDGIDTYMLSLAKKENKEIFEVETFEYQMDITRNAPDRYYELSLLSIIENYDKQVENEKELYEIWKKGDKDHLEKLLEKETPTEEEIAKYKLTEDDLKIIEDYNMELITKRNVGMKNKFNEYFNDNKKVFYMVGAAHLVGEDGIASLLENEGYTVTRVK